MQIYLQIDHATRSIQQEDTIKVSRRLAAFLWQASNSKLSYALGPIGFCAVMRTATISPIPLDSTDSKQNGDFSGPSGRPGLAIMLVWQSLWQHCAPAKPGKQRHDRLRSKLYTHGYWVGKYLRGVGIQVAIPN